MCTTIAKSVPPSQLDAFDRHAMLTARNVKCSQERMTSMGKTIDLKAADGHTLDAYSAGPANATKGVVVIQEIFGVNHHMRDMADRFAAAGYAVVAPAVYDRVERASKSATRRTTSPRAVTYRMKLDDKQLMPDVEAAAAHLAASSSASSVIALAARSRGGAPRAPRVSPPRRAGTAAASPAPRTKSRIARCRCISARRTPPSR